MAIRWPITSTASTPSLWALAHRAIWLRLLPTRATCRVRSRSTSACGDGPRMRPADRPAHQIRQRQARRARLGVPLGTLRLAGANLHPNGASTAHGAPLSGSGVRGGTAPRQPPQGTHGVWPQGVCWLNHETGVLARPWGPRLRPSAATATADAVAAHLRDALAGEPVQTDLAKRGWRWDGDRRCRAVHGLRKPERRMVPPVPMPRGTGTASVLMVDQPDYAAPPTVSPWSDSCCPSRFGDPKGGIYYEFRSAVGFIILRWQGPRPEARPHPLVSGSPVSCPSVERRPGPRSPGQRPAGRRPLPLNRMLLRATGRPGPVSVQPRPSARRPHGTRADNGTGATHSTRSVLPGSSTPGSPVSTTSQSTRAGQPTCMASSRRFGPSLRTCAPGKPVHPSLPPLRPLRALPTNLWSPQRRLSRLRRDHTCGSGGVTGDGRFPHEGWHLRKPSLSDSQLRPSRSGSGRGPQGGRSRPWFPQDPRRSSGPLERPRQSILP